MRVPWLLAHGGLCQAPSHAFFTNRSGDHTVKVSDCVTGRSVQVMNGHMRTPWVVGAPDATLDSG